MMKVLARAAALVCVLVTALALPSLATADGTPNVSLAVSSQSVLFGDTIPVTVTVSNPPGNPLTDYGYNLGVRVVLPEGIEYAGGSPVGPRAVPGPIAGETTLLFENVSDLSPSSTYELRFELRDPSHAYDVGSVVPVVAQAFVNSNPRRVPAFDAAGEGVGGSYTGFTPEQTADQEIKALRIVKSEPSREGEILRGVHDHQTVYTLAVSNNGISPTAGVTVVDHLPAELEFLGCGAATPADADNTTEAPTNPGSAEEYPGSGPIEVAPVAGCVEPDSVEAVVVDPDGDGPLGEGVHTRVVWTVGALAVGETRELRYAAAVPIRANTVDFTGPEPTPESLGQTANLDNNDGDEVTDETPLVNHATASGTYQGPSPVETADSDTLHRTAEDWVVHKQAISVDGDEPASDEVLAQGTITEWELTLRTSEYRSARDATIVDTVPSGLCPLGGENFETTPPAAEAECDPVGGVGPSAPYADGGVEEHADGTWTVSWDADSWPALAQTDVSDTLTLTFPTRTRTHYQADYQDTTPILSRDAIINSVATTADAVVRCLAPGTPDCATPGDKVDHDAGYGDGTALPDASEARQEAQAPELEKLVAVPGDGDCATATYVDTVPTYHPGDRVCWQVTARFPSGVDTSPQAIRDFLPPGAAYESGSEVDGPDNNVAAALDSDGLPDGMLAWTVEAGGGTVPPGGMVFQRRFSTIATPAAPVDGTISGNLMKLSTVNTAGTSLPLRDQVDYLLATPAIGLDKTIESVERGGAPTGAAGDSAAVQGGDSVTYGIAVANSGGQDAADVEVWDVLPPEHRCGGGLPNVTDLGGGTCVPGALGTPDRIEWTIPAIAAGATETVGYTVTVPADIGPGRDVVNHAGVRQFVGETNVGTEFVYVPEDNIAAGSDEDPGDPNAGAADDTATIFTADVAIAKSRATSIDEGGNNAAGQATIGEEILYTVTATIPEGVTVEDAVVTDALGGGATRQAYVAGSAAVTVNGVAGVPSGWTLDAGGAAPSLTLPSPYANAPGSDADTIVLTFRVRVTDVAANAAGAGLTNRGTLAWTDPTTGDDATLDSNTVSTTIVEPLLGQQKASDAGGPVAPGDIVEYTVTTTNGPGGNVSTAHDVEVVDAVPVGLTPVDADGDPLADGPIPGTSPAATWDSSEREIARTVAAIAPGGSSAFTYRVRVDDPATGGARLENVVSSTTSSIAGTPGGERTTGTRYAADADAVVTIALAQIAKSLTAPASGEATIGDPVSYELLVTIPADISLYDVTVTDVLPAEVEFASYGTPLAECVSGCGGPPTVVDAYQPDDAGARTTVAWDLGDYPVALAAPRVIRLAYHGHVRDVRPAGGGAVVAGDEAVNTATVASNQTDELPPFDPSDSIPEGFDDVSDPVDATATVVEPDLSIDKRIRAGDSGPYADGPVTAVSDDTLHYEIVVTNDGDAPAYDVAVSDLLDAALTGVAMGPLPTGTTVATPWNATDREIEWAIAGPLAPGDSVTLSYSAELVDADELADRQQVDNVAAIPSYWGVPAATRDDPDNEDVDYRPYEGDDDSTRAVLDFPTLTIDKTTGLGAGPTYPDSGEAEVGQPFPWRIVVTNTAAAATASDVVVEDVLPDNWGYTGPATVTVGGGAPATVAPTGTGTAADPLSWTVAELGPGETATIAFTATPALAAADDPGLGAGAHVNSAEVAAATDEAGNTGVGGEPYGTDPDTATATLQVPALTIDKTPDGGDAVAGEDATFTIVVGNSGDSPAREVEIRDVLPAGLAYMAGTASATYAGGASGFSETSVASGPGAGQTTIVWTVTEIPAGGSVTITLPVAVGADVAPGTLTNTASATADEEDDPVADDGTLDVETAADLSIDKSGAATYVPGEGYSWDLRVRNAGPSDAQDVVVEDELPAGVTLVSATAPCAEQPAGTVRCELGTAAAGFDETYAIAVDVDPDRLGQLENTATVTSETDDPEPGGESSTWEADPDPLADVEVVKTVDRERILRDREATFALVVRNHGPSVARAVTLEDELPAGLTFVAVDDPDCDHAGGTVSCAFGDMAPGAERSFAVTVAGSELGDWLNTATVATTTPEPPDGEPNQDSAGVTVEPRTDLATTKSAPARVAAGAQIAWQLTAVNNGPDDATGVTLTDTLPPGVEAVAADPGCAVAGGTVVCAIGDLAAGASASRRIVATVPPALGGSTLVNQVRVSGDQGDDDPSNDRDEARTTVGAWDFDLSLAKEIAAAAPRLGRPVAFRLTVTNSGPAPAPDVHVRDTLPAGLEPLSARAPAGGSCERAGRRYDCALGTLAAGQTAVVTVRARVVGPLRRIRNDARVSSSAPDRDPSNDVAAVAAGVRAPAARLRLTKVRVGGRGPVEPGRVARFRIRVSNPSRNAAAAVRVCDRLPAGLTFVAARGAKLRRGQACWDVGLLQPGRARAFAVRVRVDRDAAGRTVRNRAVARAFNAARRRAAARLTVGGDRAGRAGGVTG